MVVGLPTDRVVLLGWVVGGLALYAVVDGLRPLLRLTADWLPLVALLLAYDASRGFADGLGASVHVAGRVRSAAVRLRGRVSSPTVEA